MEEIRYWIWLSQCFSYGSEKPNQILSIFDTNPKLFYDSLPDSLLNISFLSDNDLKRLSLKSLKKADYIIQECEKLKIQIICKNSYSFPNRLKVIYGCPLVLYTQGDLSGLENKISIAVVGTRNASEYGEYITGNICYELAIKGIGIISGCAVGIDRISHIGCLKANGYTVGVLGCGIDINYPSKNKILKQEILKSGGCLITELPPGTAVQGKIFPIRNRIIAGISSGVLVTEAPVRSGALITVEHGIEQGKDIFCIPPHNIYDSRFIGVVPYLNDGATAVYSSEDIIREYIGLFKYNTLDISEKIIYNDYNEEMIADNKPNYSTVNGMNKISFINKESYIKKDIECKTDICLTEEQKNIYDYLTLNPKHLEEISSFLNIDYKIAVSIIMELEIMGEVVSYSGGRYGILKK